RVRDVTSTARERPNEIGVPRIGFEQRGGRRHLEVPEVEAGRDGAAAEGPFAAGCETGRLPPARGYDDARLAGRHVGGQHARHVPAVSVDDVQLERPTRVEVPYFVRAQHAVERRKVAGREHEINECAGAAPPLAGAVERRMVDFETGSINLAEIA